MGSPVNPTRPPQEPNPDPFPPNPQIPCAKAPGRYRLVPPTGSDRNWYVNDMQDEYALAIVAEQLPDAEEVARIAFSKVEGKR
jgi:hypothetical protein